MASTLSVAVHSSQLPETVQRELIDGLRHRRVAPKFHYQSYIQSQKWITLHNAWAPSQKDADCAGAYDRAFEKVLELLLPRRLQVIGLGCGAGEKEARLLALLAQHGKALSYNPCDVSLPLLLTATEEAQRAVPNMPHTPLMCDMAMADDLPTVFYELQDKPGRLITFFGMIPNFEPNEIMPRLAALVRPGDLLLFSANLAPGPDYDTGVRQILPGYDNPETRDWLLTFLFDIGVEPADGALEISVEDSGQFKRVVADFHFKRDRDLTVYGEHIEFREGESLRLFFSYRYTPEKIGLLLNAHKLEVAGQWISKSEEEGVFLCRLMPEES
ncbi:MAG TPA: L-histidine N(alpha)-methyltransferase [Verrucomicrobiae bacterium]|jgi:uncharacterized SAM-dependent methyltransferase|nr:L-histidine N(alpha)-methyltransferase [Verrucomicrobiae bacterium]